MNFLKLGIHDRLMVLLFQEKLFRKLRKMPSSTFTERATRFYYAGEMYSRLEAALRRKNKMVKKHES